MKILLTGGGTGGHITPILAVAHELKQLKPSCKTVYVGERGTKFAELTRDNPVIDEVHFVFAGKYRRYHTESWLRRATDIKTILLNIRDVFKAILGLVQAWLLLGKIKPDVVFLKGGFVGVPIGLASALRGIPIVTHDSDAIPGLANRLVSRWAKLHTTALAGRYYPYSAEKVRQVGVLVEPNYQPVTLEIQRTFKTKLKISPNDQLLLITGSSSGAQRINTAVLEIMGKLLDKYESLNVVHQVGKGNADIYGSYSHDRLTVLEFLRPMYTYTGAADLVVTRASANILAELGIQGKACIAIPSPYLAGGHQLKNAKILEEQGTAVVLSEDVLTNTQHGLLSSIESLLDDNPKRAELANKLREATISDAAYKLAVILIGIK